MKRSSIPCRVSLAALALLAMGSVACAGERPIEGYGSGHLNYGGSRLDASGNVSHLGNSSMAISIDQGALDSGHVYLYLCACEAANGDYLIAGVSDQHFDPETGVLIATIVFHGSAVIEGRFGDAEGTARLVIVFDDWAGTGPYEGSFDFVLDGTVDY
jgi:hypothetical protein